MSSLQNPLDPTVKERLPGYLQLWATASLDEQELNNLVKVFDDLSNHGLQMMMYFGQSDSDPRRLPTLEIELAAFIRMLKDFNGLGSSVYLQDFLRYLKRDKEALQIKEYERLEKMELVKWIKIGEQTCIRVMCKIDLQREDSRT